MADKVQLVQEGAPCFKAGQQFTLNTRYSGSLDFKVYSVGFLTPSGTNKYRVMTVKIQTTADRANGFTAEDQLENLNCQYAPLGASIEWREN